MKIYLAGPCDTENRTTMMNIAWWLRHEPGFEVYCPWEFKIEDAWHMSQENWGAQVFWKDVEAIDNCNVFLMISLGRHSTAGTNWEQGYAFAKKKVVYVIQITEETTSLMTFCGCTHFWNTNKKNLYESIKKIVEVILDPTLLLYQDKKCETVLT